MTAMRKDSNTDTKSLEATIRSLSNEDRILLIKLLRKLSEEDEKE